MKSSYSSRRRRAAIGRARHKSGTALRRIPVGPGGADAFSLPLWAAPAPLSPGEPGRETLHLRILQAAPDPLRSDLSARADPGDRKDGAW